MDFNYSADDEAFRVECRTWLEANLPKELAQGELDFFDDTGEDWERRLAWHRKMHAAGWVGISWPKEYGGRGASLMQNIIYNQELSRMRAPALVNLLGIMLVGPTLIQWGTPEQKQRYISKILSAEEIWCQGYSEPSAGSDLASLQTRAVEEGDYFVVNGQKVWTSDAHHADWCILLVRTDPDAPKHKGISYLLVDMHSPGISVRPLVQITGERGLQRGLLRGRQACRSENLVGEKNQGWQRRDHHADVRALGRRRTSRHVECRARIGGRCQDPPARRAHGVGRRGRAAEALAVRLRGPGAQVHRLSAAHAALAGTAAGTGRIAHQTRRQRA